MQMNYLKIIQCDFLDFCFRLSLTVVPMIKMTDFYMLFKWGNLQHLYIIFFILYFASLWLL